MPFNIRRTSQCPDNKPYGIFKEGTNEKVGGCHATPKSAGAQIGAIEHSEGKDMQENEEKQVAENEEKMYIPHYGVTSFTELEDLRQARMNALHVDEMTYSFQQIAANIMQDPEIENKESALNNLVSELSERLKQPPEVKSIEDDFAALQVLADQGYDPEFQAKAAMKRESGIDFPARDFAFVPSRDNPSTWKLRLTESPGKVTKAQLGRAAAALSSSGFRGNRVQLPASAMASVKRRIRSEYRKLGVSDEEIPVSVKSTNDFMLWKDNEGTYRWLAVYSNNFRDNDYPPEIIAEESHVNFVKMVDEGVVDYPELWHWHLPKTAWGKAEMVAYADGFAMAAGYIYPEHEKEAEALRGRNDILLSHGMPVTSIKRDATDRSVIRRHITQEISVLLKSAAANKLTGFFIHGKDAEMPLGDTKREYLRSVGFDDERIAAVESALVDLGKAATDADIESKAKHDDMPEDSDADEQENTPEMEKDDKKEISADLVTKEDIVQLFSETIMPLMEVAKSLKERIDSVEATVAELKASDEEKVASLKEQTPTMSQLSLSDLIKANVIGNPDARVDGRSTLGKDGPTEKSATREVTPIPFINDMLAENSP